MNSFFALITPLGEAPPGGGGGGGGGGQPPLGIWGPGDGRPTNPIAGWNPGTGNFPEQPPTGGGQPPYPSHPIYGNFPQHPIFYPPGTRPPGQGGPMPPQPGTPPGIWGPNDPRPTLPISGWNPGTGQFPEVPPGGGGGGGGGEPPQQKFDRKVGWTEQTGWVVVWVPAEGTLVPTPSESKDSSTAPVDTGSM